MRQSFSLSPKRKTTRASVRPKGRTNPYACFVKAYRQELRDRDPHGRVGFISFSRRCAKRWKTLSAEEKERFQLIAKADGRRYQREMRLYNSTCVGKKDGRRYRRQKRRYNSTCVGKKDPRAPKRPLSGFLVFCQEYRPYIRFYNPRMHMIDIAIELGKIWRQLSSWNRKPYQERAAKLKEEYMQEKSKYEAWKIRNIMIPAYEEKYQESEYEEDDEEENFDDENDEDQEPLDESSYEGDNEREKDLEDSEEIQDTDIGSYSTSRVGCEFPDDDWENQD